MDLLLVARQILNAPNGEAESICQEWQDDAEWQMNAGAILKLVRAIVQAALKYDNDKIISTRSDVYAALRHRTMSIARSEDSVKAEASKVSLLASERSSHRS